MSRGVDNVDFCAVVVYGGVFGKNGNSAFAFDVVAVHHAFGNYFVCTEDAVLLQQLVDKGCLAVVYVGNYCNVSDVVSFHTFSSDVTVELLSSDLLAVFIHN